MSQQTKPKKGYLIGLSSLLVLIIAGLLVWVKVLPEIDKKLYQLSYPELIQQYATKYDIDPYLVAAVIHVESRNHPDAVSPAGAVGLMQIMPTTGEWIAGKLGISYSEEALKNPEINIEMGCWYLNFLGQRFDSQATVLAAYNAGHGNVQEWLDNKEYSQNEKDLLEIPFPETEEYVIRVQKAYEKYKKYYPDALV